MRRRTAPLLTCLLAVSALAFVPAGGEGDVGDTLSLTGFDPGEKLDVAVTKVVDPAQPAGSFTTPDAGERFVAVQFRLKNTGNGVYNGSPTGESTVLDQQGQGFNTSYDETAAGPSFPSSVTIKPGKTALGFITFEVPNASRIVTVQYAMNSGLSDDVGEWSIP
jgi:hypothetical protein